MTDLAGDGRTDDTPAIAALLADSNVVLLPPPAHSYYLGSTLSIPSGKRLIGIGGAIPLNSDSYQPITFEGTEDACLTGFVLTGGHFSTAYMIRLTNARRNLIRDLRIVNGNSGIKLIDSADNDIEGADYYNMRGTALRVTGPKSTGNNVRHGRAVNVASFGWLIDGKASGNAITNVSKEMDEATVTDWQRSSGQYGEGRLGLECVGVRYGSDDNRVINVQAFDCHDNGISITGARNALAAILARNNHHDGLHLYGSFNSVAGLTSHSNRQSGLGISKTTQAGDASYNSCSSVVSPHNGHHGVRVDDIAHGNMVVAQTYDNGVDELYFDSVGSNTVLANEQLLTGVQGKVAAPASPIRRRR